jgi:site-specific recombinase XerD
LIRHNPRLYGHQATPFYTVKVNTSYIPLGRLERLRGSPLHPFVERYVTQAEAQNYKPKTVIWHVQLFARCSRWLHRTRRKLRDLNEKVVERFLIHELPRRESWAGAMPAFCRLLAILRVEGIAPPANPIARTSAESLADDYRCYLSNERGLRSATINNYARHVDQFLNELFGRGNVKLSALRAQEVIGFVKSQSQQHSRAWMLQVISALRSFLRFTHYRGHAATDLSPVVPIVANWRKATMPKHLPAEAVERVLNGCDKTTAGGRRNYAILLLLARLGLRAGEVIALQLEDIDWGNGQITIRSNKGQGWARLPLPVDVGEAIARYLKNDRPRCTCRNVFVRLDAPYVRLSNSPVIAVITRNALEKAGVESVRKGSHLFRHSLATEMLRRCASLDEIGQVLRHRDPDTTAIYAKVDLKALRRLAVPWKGGTR